MRADLFVSPPVKNVFEETRLDRAHGGSAFWNLLPRVFGFAPNSTWFKNAIGVGRKRHLLWNISEGPLQKRIRRNSVGSCARGFGALALASASAWFHPSIVFVLKRQLVCQNKYLFRNISAGRLEVAAGFLFFKELKCYTTEMQILASEAFLGSQK
jgi:hypothetical protein